MLQEKKKRKKKGTYKEKKGEDVEKKKVRIVCSLAKNYTKLKYEEEKHSDFF